MAATPATGTAIAGYRLERVLGTGGMGVVYEATQLSLGRAVAVKLISPHLALDPAFRERFRREAMLQAALEHPHVVTVYEAGESEGTLFLAMRLVAGDSLRELIRSGDLDADRALAILGDAASALDAAHDAGLVHRDVKPQNILVDGDGRGYLADFGLIKSAGQRGLTGSGQYLGTLDYVAPERVRGEPVSALGDVYAFAAVLYECLCGEVPFPRDTEAAVLYAHLSEPPPRPSERRPELPDVLDAVVARGLAKQPSERYRTASQLVADARAALSQSPSSLSYQTTIPAQPDGDVRAAFGSTVTDPAVLRPAPALAPSARRRLSRGAIAVLAAAALLSAAAGFALGRSSERPGRPATADAVAGPIVLEFPTSEWRPADTVPTLPGLALADAVALESTVPGSRGALVAGTSGPVAGPLLLPAAFLSELATAPRGGPVRLGPYEAVRYRGLPEPGGRRVLALYVVPTDAGAAVAACLGPSAEPGDRLALRRCEEVVATLRLRRARPLPVRHDTRYAAHVRQTLERLNARRALERRSLAAASRPLAQAAAAERLAVVFHSAATRLAEGRPGPVERPSHRRLSAALRRAAHAYRRLATAVRKGKRARYRAARADVRRSEAAVDRAARAFGS